MIVVGVRVSDLNGRIEHLSPPEQVMAFVCDEIGHPCSPDHAASNYIPPLVYEHMHVCKSCDRLERWLQELGLRNFSTTYTDDESEPPYTYITRSTEYASIGLFTAIDYPRLSTTIEGFVRDLNAIGIWVTNSDVHVVVVRDDDNIHDSRPTVN